MAMVDSKNIRLQYLSFIGCFSVDFRGRGYDLVANETVN
jgi:hypothetical protein